MNTVERQFVAAARSVEATGESQLEITSVLKAMDCKIGFSSDSEFIDAIDALMESLWKSVV